MKFEGEHLLPGQIGHFFVLLSFIASIIATISFFKASRTVELIEKQNTCIYTPVKLVKGESDTIRQFNKAADDLYSTGRHSVAVSTVRQPIEALFSWIQEKTGLQNASKVRAKSGLMVHIFGAIATSLFYHIL